MMRVKLIAGTVAMISALVLSPLAVAHISVQGTLNSNNYSQIELAIPHGCEGFDTVKVQVTLPAGLTGVRPIDSVFGTAQIIVGDDGEMTALTWSASKVEPYPTDSHAYSISFRAKTPDAPFNRLYFPTVQTCEDPDGNIYTSQWVGMGGHDHDGESDVLPAPSAVLYPKVTPGWYEFTASNHLHDMSIFSAAEIVWKGEAAFSANPNTAKMIIDDSNVAPLTEIHPGETFWVKY